MALRRLNPFSRFMSYASGSNPPTAAIFDFDGTLADSERLTLSIYNEHAPRLGVPPVTADDVEHLRTLGPFDALKELNIPMWKVPRVVHAVRTGMHAQMGQLAPFPGIVEALHELRAGGAHCYVLSTNSASNIEAFLNRYDMNLFEKLAGGSSAFGKARYLRKLIRTERLAFDRAFYVGDEVRDIHAARDAGVRSVAVSWGYSARAALLERGPDVLVDAPSELARRILAFAAS